MSSYVARWKTANILYTSKFRAPLAGGSSDCAGSNHTVCMICLVYCRLVNYNTIYIYIVLTVKITFCQILDHVVLSTVLSLVNSNWNQIRNQTGHIITVHFRAGAVRRNNPHRTPA